jgi:hypothetical protein
MVIVNYFRNNVIRNSFNLLPGFFLILMITTSASLKAQILKDTSTINILRNGMFNIYNIEFENASKAYNAISQRYPGHPVLHLFNGMKIYWENFPLTPTAPARVKFEAEMRKCIEISDKNSYPSAEYEAEYLLSNICARGLLLLFLADNDQSDDVMPLVTSSYRPLMRTFKFASDCPDFYYFTGVYNYYRDAYPQVYPVYKAIAFIFPKGDMELGLEELEKCGKYSIALKAEAYAILSWIRMNFESNFKLALPYSQQLTATYPSNPLYKAYYIKNLLLLKKYDEAEKYIKTSGNTDSNHFFQAVLKIYNGIIQEKKYRNLEAATILYKKGIDELGPYSPYSNEYMGYGYYGLSRIGEAKGNDRDKRYNHRKATDLVDFKKINFDE